MYDLHEANTFVLILTPHIDISMTCKRLIPLCAGVIHYSLSNNINMCSIKSIILFIIYSIIIIAAVSYAKLN